MAQLKRGSVVRGAPGALPRPDAAMTVTGPIPRGRVVAGEVVRAHDEAARIVSAAQGEAARIEREARTRAATELETLRAALTAEADARIAAELVHLHVGEDTRAARDEARLVDTAVALAERLIGATLELDPARIGAMAQAALRDARGARHLVFEAHPLDAGVLETQLEEAGLSKESFAVEPRDDLARGDLVLRTDLGTLDARRKPQLQRLAAALLQRRSARDR